MNLVDRSTRIALNGIRAAVAGAGVPADLQRRAAVYLLVTGCNVPGATAARAIGVSKQYVWKVLRQVEDLREDPDCDRALAKIERGMFEAGE